MDFEDYWDAYIAQVDGPLCGAYLGDNDATCPQLTCIRKRGHEGLHDNARGDETEGSAEG